MLNFPEAKHAYSVLRIRKDQEIIVFDGKGNEYVARVKSLSATQGRAEIINTAYHEPEKMKITLAASIPKKSKFEHIVDKATQLGVQKIVPLLTKRTIFKATPEKAKKKMVRWQCIAQETAKQCESSYLPEISEITTFDDAVKTIPSFDLAIIASLDKDSLSIKGALKRKKPDNMIVFIGPEGDFSPDEISTAKENGALNVTLGRNVLRCETAVTAVLSILNYELRL